MSETPTCWNCGAAADHDPDYGCDYIVLAAAQRDALLAAHDAAMAEAERTWLRYWDHGDRWYHDYHAMKRRADAAEAQIAEAREEYAELLRMNHGLAAAARRDAEQLAQARADGARSMAAMLKEHWLAGIDCDHETKADRPRCACSRVNFGWYKSVGEAVNRWTEHLLAAWQAHETEATG